MKKIYMVLCGLIMFAQGSYAQENDSIANDTTMLFQQLNEVMVISDLPKVRTNAEGMKVFVSGTELEKVGSTKDLLRRLPTVQSADDGVQIFGRGAAEVYVNGRKLYDMKELEQIPSDQLMHIEIINNPGARYAASTKAVVRIKTKRPQGEGWGLRNELKPTYFSGFGISDQLDVNYHKGGFDFAGMLSGSTKNQDMGAVQKFSVYTGGKLMEQVMDKLDQEVKTRQLATKLQLNYQFNDKHSIGVRYAFNRTPYLKNNAEMPTVFTLDKSMMQESMSHIHQSMPSYMHTVNMYYNGSVKDWQFDVNLDGVWNDSKVWNVTEETIKGNGQSLKVSTFNHSTSSLYAAKFVAEHPLWGGRISLGTEYDFTRRIQKVVNPMASDGDTKVNENIWAFFAEYNRLVFKKMNVRAGLRLETVNSDYYEWDKHEMSRDYTDLFPSIGLSMPVGKVYLNANYSIDISRPSFSYLNNNIIFLNSYSYQGGNPYLKPTYTHSLSLMASWKWLYAMASVSRIKDDIQVQNVSYSADNPLITLVHPANLPAYNRLTIQVVASPTLFKVWHPSWIAVMMAQDYETQMANGSKLKLSRPLAQFMWNNLVDLPHGWRIGFDMLAMTTGDLYTYRMHKGCFSLDASVYKSFFKNKLEVRAQVSDITAVRSQPVTIYCYRDYYVKNDNHPQYELSVVYKFNMMPDKYRGRGAGDKQKNRIN